MFMEVENRNGMDAYGAVTAPDVPDVSDVNTELVRWGKMFAKEYALHFPSATDSVTEAQAASGWPKLT